MMTKYKHKVSGDIAIRHDVSDDVHHYHIKSDNSHYNVPAYLIEENKDWELMGEPIRKWRWHITQREVYDSKGHLYRLRDLVESPETGEASPILSFIEEYSHDKNEIILAAQVGIWRVDVNDLRPLVMTTEDKVNIFNPLHTMWAVDSFGKAYHTLAYIARAYKAQKWWSSREVIIEHMTFNLPIVTLAEIAKMALISSINYSRIKELIKEKLEKDVPII